jgi:hypothetical protein
MVAADRNSQNRQHQHPVFDALGCPRIALDEPSVIVPSGIRRTLLKPSSSLPNKGRDLFANEAIPYSGFHSGRMPRFNVRQHRLVLGHLPCFP